MTEAIEDQAAAALEAFFELTPGEGSELLPHVDIVTLVGGQWLFHQGDAGDSLYLCFRGRLEAVSEGREDRVLGEVVPGESVGEVAMLTGEVRSAGIRAIRDCALVKIGPVQFSELAATHHEVVLKLAGHVARRLYQNTVSGSNKLRAPQQICLVSLHGEASRGVAAALARKIGEWGSVLELSLSGLAAAGAPSPPTGTSLEISNAFSHWMWDQELQYDFVILHCAPDDGRWLEFASRQADRTLLIASSDGDMVPLSIGDQVSRHLALALCHGSDIGNTSRWLDHYPIQYHCHLRDGNGGDLARAARLVTGRGNGLVLGGGAARGFAHLGIYRALIDAGLPIDWVGGASIGAILGAAIALDQGADAATEMAREAFVEGRPFGDYTIPVISLLAGKRMTRLTQLHLPGCIEDLPIPFFAVSANITSGTINVHDRGAIWEATNASAALPGVLPPMIHRSQLAVDGAVLNNLPVDIMQTKPVRNVFAVDLSAQELAGLELEAVPSPWRAALRRILPFGAGEAGVPGLASVVLKSIEVATRARSKEMGERADLLFLPPVQAFGLLDVGNFDEIVRIGYEHAVTTLRDYRPIDR